MVLRCSVLGYLTVCCLAFPVMTIACSMTPQLPLGQNSLSGNTDGQIQSLRGVLRYDPLPAVMSERSYFGEEFFLETAGGKLVLFPSEKVTVEQLQVLQNQSVTLQVVYRQGVRPSGQEMACPVDHRGQCLPRGEGFYVLAIGGSPK